MPNLPSHHIRPSVLAVTAALVLTACTTPSSPPSATPGVSASPSSPASSPSISPTVGAIDHPTGATDVVLRMDQGGGFVPIEFLASQAPTFTLYGNGVIVFQRQTTNGPQPDAKGVVHNLPWRTATLDESQIQELLEFALGAGGLGAARDAYIDGGIADAPNTIFTVDAGGVDKTVVINALSDEPRPGPDALARSAFWKLAQRLSNFDQGGSVDTDVYMAERWRGVVSERDAQPGVAPTPWPWPNIAPADFKESQNDDGPRLPHRVMTAEEVAALKIDDTAGGLQGLVLAGPNGKQYTFILRPLLVDEKV
jgi:hypothetical protein